MDKIIKPTELDIGEFTIIRYEPKMSKFGKTYILTCDNGTKFWSNAILNYYIMNENPKKKFVIIKDDKKISIVGYSSEVDLQ